MRRFMQPPRHPWRLLGQACVCALAAAVAPAAVARPAQTAAAANPALEHTLMGEFALQQGRLKDSARAYLAAALATGDAGLAERATRIALLADDNATARQALGPWLKAALADAGARMAELTLLVREGEIDAAAERAKALTTGRGGRDWRFALLGLSTTTRDPQPAAEVIQRLVDAQALPNEAPAWLAFGGLAQRLGRPQLARTLVEETRRRFPGEPRVALLDASQQAADGHFDAARSILGTLSPHVASDPRLRLMVAAQYESLGASAEAERVLAQGPQDNRTIALRASLLDRSGNRASLAALYESVKAGKDRGDATRLLLGNLAETLKRNDQALAWYRGVGEGEHYDAARLRIANVLHVTGRKAQAYAALKALQADARAENEVQRDAYLLEAELHRKDGDDAAEIAAYDRALATFEDDGAALYARALAFERQDRIDRSEADLRKLLVSDPTNTAALNALGYTLADRTTRYAEALQLIDRARAAEPANPAILDSYGWVLYRLGKPAEALPWLRRAYSLQKDPDIATHIGEVLWVQGEQAEARTYFEAARTLEPGSAALRRTLQKLGVSQS